MHRKTNPNLSKSIIIFDLVDTLIQVLPSQNGVMAQRLEVQAMPFANVTLASLSRNYRLIIATDEDSADSDEVLQALQQVDLHRFIERVYTKNELGYSKNEPEFYIRLALNLGIEPLNLTMIVDDFEQDVLAADAVQVKTIWFNRHGILLRNQLPYQVGEVSCLAELPALLARGLLPRLQACNELISTNEAPHNIRQHMSAVAALAYGLAVWLKAKGILLDPVMVQRAAYLHDIDKINALEIREAHGVLGAKILQQWGQPELATIVQAHVLEQILLNPESLAGWETKLVYYADKRYDGDQLVTVKKRCEALVLRYPQSAALIAQALPLILMMEAEISTALGVDLSQLIAPELA